jgi:hypothetical protein
MVRVPPNEVGEPETLTSEPEVPIEVLNDEFARSAFATVPFTMSEPRILFARFNFEYAIAAAELMSAFTIESSVISAESIAVPSVDAMVTPPAPSPVVVMPVPARSETVPPPLMVEFVPAVPARVKSELPVNMTVPVASGNVQVLFAVRSAEVIVPANALAPPVAGATAIVSEFAVEETKRAVPVVPSVVVKFDAAPVVIPTVEPEVRPIAPAAEFPMVTAPVEVPVLMFVAKFDEALSDVAPPVMVRPAEPERSDEKVFAPAMVCVVVETSPGFVPSASESVRTFAVILPPFAFVPVGVPRLVTIEEPEASFESAMFADALMSALTIVSSVISADSILLPKSVKVPDASGKV